MVLYKRVKQYSRSKNRLFVAKSWENAAGNAALQVGFFFTAKILSRRNSDPKIDRNEHENPILIDDNQYSQNLRWT